MAWTAILFSKLQNPEAIETKRLSVNLIKFVRAMNVVEQKIQR